MYICKIRMCSVAMLCRPVIHLRTRDVLYYTRCYLQLKKHREYSRGEKHIIRSKKVIVRSSIVKERSLSFLHLCHSMKKEPLDLICKTKKIIHHSKGLQSRPDCLLSSYIIIWPSSRKRFVLRIPPLSTPTISCRPIDMPLDHA